MDVGGRSLRALGVAPVRRWTWGRIEARGSLPIVNSSPYRRRQTSAKVSPVAKVNLFYPPPSLPVWNVCVFTPPPRAKERSGVLVARTVLVLGPLIPRAFQIALFRIVAPPTLRPL